MQNSHLDLALFKKSWEEMVAVNASSWDEYYSRRSVKPARSYSLDEVRRIIGSSSLEALRKLSRDYFDRDGFYRKILMYYATLLTYSGLLVPNPSANVDLSTPSIQKKYYNALAYIDRLNLPEVLTRISLKVLVDGAYYGVIQEFSKERLVLLDLPAYYCSSRFKDYDGNDLIEFDVQYFDCISDMESRQKALDSYPKVISSYYRKWKKGKVSSSWVLVPSGIGICFTLADDGRPMFLNIIPASIQYEDAIDTERERELEEIRKIIVQKIPHLTDGQLLFEPPEAEVMHNGAVNMLKSNKNLSVLTTYADVDAVISKTAAESISNSLEKMLQNVYAEAGVSGELFAPTGSQALKTSIENDIALMMILGNKYGRFISSLVNELYGNLSLDFNYHILPVSYYNRSDYITDAFKLAQSGYSFLVPSIAMGVSQYELANIKILENDVLKLRDRLIPLSSAYTQSSKNEVGTPEKALEDKSEKTIQNEDAIDHQ